MDDPLTEYFVNLQFHKIKVNTLRISTNSFRPWKVSSLERFLPFNSFLPSIVSVETIHGNTVNKSKSSVILSDVPYSSEYNEEPDCETKSQKRDSIAITFIVSHTDKQREDSDKIDVMLTNPINTIWYDLLLQKHIFISSRKNSLCVFFTFLYFLFRKVKILWEGHKIWKKLPAFLKVTQ